MPGDIAADARALFARAEREARRQGIVGPSSPASIKGVPTDIAATVLAQPREPALDERDRVQLTCALDGTDKFAKMRELKRDHIFKMLEADDRPGLAAVVEDGNSLRSFATGLKVGKQLIEKRGADSLPSALREPLRRIKVFYEKNPRLVELGDERGLYPEHARKVEDVAQLRDAFSEAQELLNDLRRALSVSRDASKPAMSPPGLPHSAAIARSS
ncbi:hypothetical protein GWC77_27490 [Paraburkholderia sp. NMBU_R16]|uniref:hypothetical protein n=1 Tax=Paraburkholderia sp. NMBU_R16 TaxID=2698676 RepID=UPI0015667C6F|nr:hypothetical protein [Paraburkholderia sp. NMBU_R16]NRO99604.1 hypothetical protein [Paraburkholderia sp. NMBU_R16]